MRFYKPLAATTALIALLLLFYYSLIDALNKHKDVPIADAVRQSQKKKSEAEMTPQVVIHLSPCFIVYAYYLR